MPPSHLTARSLALTSLLAGCALVSNLDQQQGSGGVGGATTAATSSGEVSGATTAGSGGDTGPATTGPASSGLVGSTSGTGGEGGGGGGGGDGGGPLCGGADLATDPANCGECGFDCGDRICVAGRCDQEVDLGDFGHDITALLIADDRVWFVQRQLPGSMSGEFDFVADVKTLPLDFGPETEPEVVGEVVNGIGSLAAGTLGTHRVYFSGQRSGASIPQDVYACSPDACVTVDYSPCVRPDECEALFPQANGLVVVGPTLYILEGAGGNRVLSAPIDPISGVPGELTPEVVAHAEGLANWGVRQIFALQDPSRLLWGSVADPAGDPNGCLFVAEIADLPLASPIDCWSPLHDANGIAVSPDGRIFVEEWGDRVLRAVGDPPELEEVTTGAQLRAADDRFLYVRSTSTNAIRAIPLEGGPDAGNSPIPPSYPYAVDVLHPDYAFYVTGDRIHRWPKPR